MLLVNYLGSDLSVDTGTVVIRRGSISKNENFVDPVHLLVWAWPASPNEMESLGTARHCIRNDEYD